MQAIWNNKIIAQSENFLIIGGVYFFPSSAVHSEYIKTSDMSSQDTGLGKISYQDVEVDGNRLEGAAIKYSNISEEAKQTAAITNSREGSIDYSDYIGFTNGIEVKKP